MSEIQVVTQQAPTPIELIAKAIERGLDAGQLERLFDLQERFEKSRAVEAFHKAMVAAQAEMPIVVRDDENPQTRSRYATLDNINTTVKPTYTKHGFGLSFGEESSPIDGFRRIVCDVRHVGGHEVRYHVDLPVDGVGAQGGRSAMNAVQGCISTGSYGQRVLICRVFNITIADTDRDGQQRNGGGITEEEAGELNDLLEQTGADIGKFLQWAGQKEKREIADLTGISRATFAQAKADAERRLRKAVKS